MDGGEVGWMEVMRGREDGGVIEVGGLRSVRVEEER